ncbi:M1 family aminopeptidase [Pontibacter sp. HSC-36F09]|uniref:M1 family aminopeptidase n=1 Tax=Pontibacter sp. HSC-36F09 TaxID=2910966 RepID=UPI00209D1642|nr:M1 family aminopeptidase [Pontibacter sp. HSC-36F09]MCP2043178.1 hypothetical protein [Pontibacter sp. HSC-36F09]
MKTGLINCRFTLTNVPALEKYSILLNKGMNVKYFKDSEDKLMDYAGHFGGNTNGEAIAYAFTNAANDTVALPSAFKVEYKGAFPVYAKNDLNVFDYKGIIAFNGQTVRATEQTKWYPVIYDAANDRLLHDYTYDLTISIKDGSSIFINGSAPQEKQKARFTSTKAYPLLLFAGNYNFLHNGGDYILNADISQQTAEKIFNNIGKIKAVLAANLQLDFTDNIYLINHSPVNERPKGSSWGFNTYPSFAFTGLNFEDLITKENKFPDNIYKYYGHEFGHNYFGNNVFSGKLSWFWLESFAEYLSYNVAEDIVGQDFLNQTLLKQAKQLEGKTFTPLNEVKQREDIDNTYRYVLAPLMLKCFEDTFGREKMNGVIKSLLRASKSETLTLEHWKQAALQQGIPEKDFRDFEKAFVESKDFKQNIVNAIVKKHS